MDSYNELKCEGVITSSNLGSVAEKNILHFSDGTLHLDDLKNHEDVTEEILVDPQTLSWGPWMWYYTTFAGSKALQVCDFFGESLATFFGITTPKYQYEITEYNRIKREEEENRKRELEKSNSWSANSSLSAPVTAVHQNVNSEEFPLKTVTCVEPETK